MINWKEEVKEYKKQYDDDGDITEYIDSLVPQYYSDILKTFNYMTFEIAEHHIGLPVWQVMGECIYNDYYESFMEAWTPFEDEEE
jgi:hypothetical protein